MNRARLSLVSSCCVAFGALLFSSGARAGDSIGPDVVVGDLYQTQFWGSVGNLSSYSVGTESCNFGDVPLEWFANTSRHPVIGQNIYRLKDGRLEMLGQSWLKWGFASLNLNACGDCIDPGTSSLLGVNCSDPYSAGLNGQQGRLGPKSQVNPFTGAFPASHPTPGGGTLAGRAQVLTSEMQPSQNAGALYFVEGQYIAPDDAEAGNDLNNASYRQVWVQSNLSLTFNRPSSQGGGQSETVRRDPAIFAWQAFDNDVALRSVDVPNEGRFYIGYKAIDQGNGNWTHRFAVQNLNSHRALRALTINLPAGANASNTWFRDVAYHSGEPFSGTDWTPIISANSVRWETQTFAQNSNANALRWGTMYNFEFDADFGPDQIGQADFELFRSGTPSNVVFDLPRPNTNERCAAASIAQDGANIFNNIGAISAGFSETCGFDAANDADVWFRYISICTGPITFETIGSNFDTRLAIYEGSCPSDDDQAIACANDTNGQNERITIQTVFGREYFIRVGGVNGAEGNGLLTIACGVSGGGPLNDDCDSPISVSDGNTPFNNINATPDGPAESTCGGLSSNSADIWYSYLAPCSGTVTVEICDADFDTVVAVYNSSCPSGANLLVCNDNGCGTNGSSLNFSALGGIEYTIRVAGSGDQTGSGTLSISCDGAGGLCPNDTQADARVIDSLPFTEVGNTEFCTNDYDLGCPFGSPVARDAVYSYTPLVDSTLNIGTCNSTFDTRVYVYRDSISPGNDVACSDNGCPTQSFLAQITDLSVQAGRTYFIVVDGFSNEAGQFILDVEAVCNEPVGEDRNGNGVSDVCDNLGDSNCDGVVNTADIDAFVQRLLDPAGYAAAYPNCLDSFSDINGDSVINTADIDSFVDVLLN